MHTRLLSCLLALMVCALVGHSVRLSASDPQTGDWPMWGGTPDRNMVSKAKNLPTEWDVKTKKNIVWVADTGSQSYGNPVVGDGMVFIGTNNGGMRDKNQPGERGVLMAFSEEIFWAGITSVAKGQWEAARSTGLTFGQTLVSVVLPQAFRLTIPPLTNRTIALTKGTALGPDAAVT